MNNEEQWLESINLDLQEGFGSESTELTSSTLESTSTKHSLARRTLKGESKALKKGITSNCVHVLQLGALYRPQKAKGRPSDKTHEKTTQKVLKIQL